MNVEFHPKFNKDIDAIKLPRVAQAVEQIILSAEAAAKLSDIPNLQKMKGAVNTYRIRTGTYRIGLFVKNDTLIFTRILHRRDIYRSFP